MSLSANSVFHAETLTSRPSVAAKETPKVNYCYKLFRVRRGSDNGVTTVSVDPVLATVACRALGGIREVSLRVRELSLSFDAQQPPGRNRSRFVSTALRREVDTQLAGRNRATSAAAKMTATAE